MAKALYVAYFTGVAGQSLALFYIGDGVLAGVDVATMKYTAISPHSQMAPWRVSSNTCFLPGSH